MRVFIIDTSTVAPELQSGLIGVAGSPDPTAAEKQECVETVSRYVMDGWAIAADPTTPIGWLAALTAETACVQFINSPDLLWMTLRDSRHASSPSTSDSP